MGGTRLQAGMPVVGSLVVVVIGLALLAVPPQANGQQSLGQLVEADTHTGTAGPVAPGEFELAVLSTRAETVTAGDALIGVRGLTVDDEVTVTRNGQDVTDRFTFDDDGVLAGLVAGLEEGANTVTVVAEHPVHGRRGAQLPIQNHPVVGPVFSGPHQEPFYCETVEAGLGEPTDDDCSIHPRVEWYWYDQTLGTFEPLEDPYAPYPDGVTTTTTTEGETVPYVIRVESRTINRGITRVAVLDDPAARGPDAPYEPSAGWNEKILYQWGPSCGVGRHQGVTTVDSVTTSLPDAGTGPLPVPGGVVESPLGMGYLTAASSLTTLGVHCNTVLSAETFMMVSEHITEQYGLPTVVFGNGASGGAIQQVTTIDNYPGLLDGGIPMATFPDVITTAMSPADCRLLLAVFDKDPLTWNEVTIQAVTGHRTRQICQDWSDFFGGHLVAESGCAGAVPDEDIYDPETNPDGVRCTLQDALVNIMGIDPATGFAHRPLDNIGIQYGLRALQQGLITPEMFVTLNEDLGGYDIDGNIVDQRMAMDADLARKMYEIGAVSGRGALAESPTLFISPYLDLVPVLDFHDAVRAYMLRERLREHAGTDRTQAIWAGAPLPNDAWSTMDAWTSALEDERQAALVSADGWTDEIVATRPDSAEDQCVLTSAGIVEGGLPLILDAGEVDGPCETVFAPLGSPRIVAGGPLSEDIIKCSRKPLVRDDYRVAFTDDQWARMEATFPDGVCDWTQPGVGEVDRSRTWLDFGDTIGADPTPITHHVARSTAAAAAPAPTSSPAPPSPAPPGPPLPATGGGIALVAVGLAAMASARRRRTTG